MNHIVLNHKVIINKVSGVGAVGIDSSNLGRSQKNIFRSLVSEKVLHVLLNFKVQLLMSPQNEASETLRLEAPQDSGTNQASMTSYIDFRGPFHIQAEAKVEV